MAYDAGGKRQVYASVDNFFAVPPRNPIPIPCLKSSCAICPLRMCCVFKSYLLEGYLKENNFPRDLKPETVRQKLESGDITPLQLVEYLEDANSLLFDTPVKGLEVYALDAGKKQPTWRRTMKTTSTMSTTLTATTSAVSRPNPATPLAFTRWAYPSLPVPTAAKPGPPSRATIPTPTTTRSGSIRKTAATLY